MKIVSRLLTAMALAVMVACSPSVPVEFTGVDSQPNIYPEYADVTIPYNIAPLTFRIDEPGDEYVTRFSYAGNSIVVGGKEVAVAVDEWAAMLEKAKGTVVNVEVFVKKDDTWSGFAPFGFSVSPDAIDPYISYRLIPPSYVAYEKLSICQRELSSYDEKIIYNNMLVSAEPEGQCINCHAYKNYKTDNMQFHVRQYKGGTVFVHDGEIKKLDMKTDSTISAGVYPSFNPVYDVVAYSVNNTGQIFHTKHPNKVEVQDKASDVIVYNPVNETVAHVAKNPDELEVFPCWSPDGKSLYYCSSVLPRSDTTQTVESEMIMRYKEVKYNVFRRSWNPETGEFGVVDTVFMASPMGKSVTFPRISPCGKYMLFSMAEYGCFHIWHNDADLYVLNLETKEFWPLEKANSPYPESYHAWSSNGRWILFASRRDDTNYSRLYIAHVNPDGAAAKAFLLPQESGSFYDFFDRSFNVPEFMTEPVGITPQKFAEVVKGDAVKVKYSSKVK